MIVPKDVQVERPTKRTEHRAPSTEHRAPSTEHRLIFATHQAQKGWRDLRATKLNALADAWDSLTRDPVRNNPTCHPLKGGARDRHRQQRGARTTAVRAPGRCTTLVLRHVGRPGTVHLLDVHTHHPNATK